jgi:class 3 adenylate cyclase
MSAAMRAVFRADPDVLMIGEVRDREAATMAVEAAVTGRLVLTVMHADDAALGVTRLIDAVEPVLAASALICAAGQRLARMLCEACREPYEPAPEELLRLGLPPNGRTLYTARGCPDCAMTGYRGRVALIEAMVFTDDLRRLVLDRASADELRRAAVTAGMRTLRDEAIAGVLEGRLSFEEVDRVGLSKPIEEIVREVERARPTMGAAPDGTVTMMFTDIESSTAIAERLGDEHWMSLLRAHNLIVREHAAALGGFEVKTIGDAFMLAFDSARDALECAIRVQRSLATLETGRAGAEIRVRIGLHTGEAIREADDFYGRAVTLASRIAREAAGSQILASAIVKELVAGGGFVFGEPREAEIKGMEGRQTLYEVVWSVP